MKTKYPMVLEDGAARVTVRKISDHGRASFMLDYHWGGKRKQKVRADENEAHSDARRILAMMLDEAPKFSDTEGAGVLKSAACALTGIELPVDVVCREYANAVRALGGMPLSEAVALALRYRPLREEKNVPEIVDEYLIRLAPDARPAYFKNTRHRLRRFARSFPGPIGRITKSDLEKWLHERAISNVTRNGERRLLVGLFRWARSEKYLPNAARTEAEEIKTLKTTMNIETFDLATVEKLMRHLEKNRPEYLVYAAIGIFAGVRPAELARLDFSAIRWAHGDIEIRADQSKTNARRLIEMEPNLKLWLAPYRNSRGPICVRRRPGEKLHEIAKSIGIEWTPDVMRHSFISYAVALKNEIGSVALRAGNSEGIIKRHYLKRVTAEEGRAFFAIAPRGSSKVVHFKAA